MRAYTKTGGLVLIFTCLFLIIFPAFLDRWPTIFGIACVFLFIPRHINMEGNGKKRGLWVSVFICGVNVALILVFCDKDILAYQIVTYLSAFLASFFMLITKKMIIKQKGKDSQ